MCRQERRKEGGPATKRGNNNTSTYLSAATARFARLFLPIMWWASSANETLGTHHRVNKVCAVLIHGASVDAAVAGGALWVCETLAV